MARPEQLPPPEASAEEIRRTADEVLARPEFRQPPETLIERLRNAVGEALQDAVEALFSTGRNALFAWAAVAVVVGMVVVVGSRVLTGMRHDPAARRSAKTEADPRRPPIDWDREARQHAAQGRWRDAIRCRYRGLVERLAAIGAIEEITGRTAGEHRLEVLRSRPAAAKPFDEATEVFERTWYGGADAGPDDDDRLRRAAELVLAEAR